MDFRKRRRKLFRTMEEEKDSLIILTDPGYIYYLTGYHGALGIEWGRPELFLMTGDGESILITPLMEEEMALKQTSVDNVIPWTDGLDGEWRKPLGDFLKKHAGGNIGVDYPGMPRVIWDFIAAESGREKITDISPHIDRMRMIKDEDEVQVARHAGEVAVAMLEGAMARAAPEVFEYEVALAAMKAGTEKAASLMAQFYPDEEPFNFPTISNQQIMATGSLTTMCHHRNGMTRLKDGEPLFICHCGTAQFKGFYPGFDRILFVGGINEETQKLLETAERAQAAALREVKPGAVAEDVYHAYAEAIQSAGYPIPFRAGRSIGFSVNAPPQLAYGDKTVLEKGMTFAVDGGADGRNYRAQVGDSILVTENGYEFLTPFTKEHSELIVGKFR